MRIWRCFSRYSKRKYGSDDNVDVIINPDKGDLEIWLNREIVKDEDFEHEGTQIKYTKALKSNQILKLERKFLKSKGWRFWTKKYFIIWQNLASKVLELEKDSIYQKYKEELEILLWRSLPNMEREILILDDDGNELILPKTEQIPSDYFRKGDTTRAVVSKVDLRNNSPVIILSDSSRIFSKTFEQEVPEVFDGLITIKELLEILGKEQK